MENLKKNFEEPVVQIINMCFCENIATSGDVACPLSYKSYADNQRCRRCQVIYHIEGSVTAAKIGHGNSSYISTSTTITTYLNGLYPGQDLSDQVEMFAAQPQIKCPAGYPKQK